MQMTFDITSISLRRVYLNIGKFCERCFAGCAIDLHGAVNFASGLSNHCQQQNMSARREASGVLFLYMVLYLGMCLRYWRILAQPFQLLFKEGLYIIWCGVNRLGDSGVHTKLAKFENPKG